MNEHGKPNVGGDSARQRRWPGRKLLELVREKSVPTQAEVETLIHELEVQAVELEMENRELRHTLHELARSRRKYLDLYDSTPVACATFDLHGRVLEANLTCEKLLGVDRATLPGSLFVDFVAGPSQQRFLEHVRACIQTRQAGGGELELLCNGVPVAAEMLCAFAESPALGLVCRAAMSSVAERRKAEHAASLARQAAEKANEAKTRFLANVSHDLRTPMTAILGLTEMALAEPLNDEVRGYLTTVDEAAKTLLELLNELLDVARVEEDELELRAATLHVRSLVRAVIGLLEGNAAAKALGLTSSVDPAIPEQVVGDLARIRQILINLVGNAIKFTEHGTIELRVVAAGLRGEHVDLEFAVTDTGVGIAPQELQRVFERFAKGDVTDERPHEGSGLGLAIAANLARMMGGKIHAQSTLGKGSTFSLVVTLGRAADEDAESAASEGPASARMQGPAVRPLRVLVVEDSSMLQLLVRVVLGKRGHAVTVAGDGLTALQVLARERFDLVLMDVQMPNMDGFAATLAIRSLPDPHARLVPIVAMTAHAMAEHRRQCLAGGMDDYLAKPIRSRDLIAVVERLGARQDRLEVIAP